MGFPIPRVSCRLVRGVHGILVLSHGTVEVTIERQTVGNFFFSSFMEALSLKVFFNQALFLTSQLPCKNQKPSFPIIHFRLLPCNMVFCPL